MVDARVNARQLEVLRWIAEGCPGGKWADGDVTYKLSASALKNRGLITTRGRSAGWTAALTPAGEHYLKVGEYPEGHRFGPKPKPVDPPSPKVAQPVQEPSSTNLYDALTPASRRAHERKMAEKALRENRFRIDSPNRQRAQAGRRGAQADEEVPEHPWNDKVLLSVKEAAWLLSLSESMIRDAVKVGDVDRVYIGAGTTQYRVVHASLLAWVNSLPQEPVRGRW